MACAQIEWVSEALIGWLDSIDGGRNPALYIAPGRGPQLCKTAEVLSLLTWARCASGMALPLPNVATADKSNLLVPQA